MQTTNYQKVFEFHETFDVARSSEPNIDNIRNYKISSLRVKLIVEEFDEYIEAMDAKNNTEMMDALGDLLYVVYGTGVSFGINLDDAFKNYCRQEIERREFFFSTTSECDDMLELRSNYHKIMNLFGTNGENCANFITNFDYTILNLSYSILNGNVDLITDELCQMLHILYEVCYHNDINADQLFTIIHNSNMTKMCQTEEEAKKTVDWYVETRGELFDPFYVKSINDKYWIVRDKKTNKCLKSINYVPVDLSSL